jgi:DNA-directed RNA polymerase subunit F
MWDVREAMYPEKMTTEQLAEAMEDLTDMQNHVLPYLQSFCSLEEKGVQERREQQIAEKRRTKWNQIS